MAISKSTPYVRYKKDFTSSLHLGTIHIESEYLDRTQKTTIESIHGMTWHNKVVNENKELNLLSDTQLELTELEKQYWNTGEKRVSVDEIHTLEEVEPNEDGTYTYTVNSMEGEYIEIYDGVNNITSTSDGLNGQFEIVYDTTEEDINGNIALDSIVPQYEITDSGVGVITSAKSTGLTLVNNITESSKEEVVTIEQQEGQYFTIENTVQGNIKSASMQGQTLVNLAGEIIIGMYLLSGELGNYNESVATTPKFLEKKKYTIIQPSRKANKVTLTFPNIKEYKLNGVVNGVFLLDLTEETETLNNELKLSVYDSSGSIIMDLETDKFMILEGDYTENYQNIPYFEGMQSVKMPVLTTTGKNLFNPSLPFDTDYYRGEGKCLPCYYDEKTRLIVTSGVSGHLNSQFQYLEFKPNTKYTFSGNIVGHQHRISVHNEEEQVEANGIGRFVLTTTTGDSGRLYVSILKVGNPTSTYGIENLQIEENSIATSYEPYKSNILTVNEPVELRGIGDVQDTLDCLTGEVVERIGEIVLDGSEETIYAHQTTDTETLRFFISCFFGYDVNVNTNIPFLTNSNLPNSHVYDIDEEGIFSSWGGLFIRISKTRLMENSAKGLKNYLQSNPITVQYQLATESVKTVDLTVTDQDNNIIPHIQTQPTITHVSTSSDGLTPVVEMSCSYDTIIKPNTTYTIKLDRPIVSDTMYLQVDLGGTMMMLDADVNAFTIKTPSTLSHSQLRLSGTGNTVKEIIVLEGNRVNDKIKYFEGMENVENPILVVSSCPYVFGKGGRL